MIGLSYGNFSSSGVGGFDPVTSAIIAQMTANGSTPSEARQAIINQLVLDLKGLGNTGSDDIWSRLDILNIHAAADAIQAQTQWINADGTYDSVQVGTPTFTADVGFSSTNLVNRIDPIWTPSVQLGNYTLNNASMGFYGVVEDSRYFLTDSSVNNITFRASQGNNFEAAFNSTFITSSGDWGSLDNLFVLDRNSSANFNKYTGTSLIATNTRTSSSLTSNQIRYPYGFSSGGSQTAKIFFAGASVRDVLPQLKASFDAYLAAL
jgi:hypothetical protein